MPMKLKIGFTVSAETLFGLMAKVLPIENFHVEEILEREPLAPRRMEELARPAASATAKKRPRRNTRRGAIDLKAGANEIVLALLSDGEPHRAAELKPLFQARGYAPTGVGSRLEKLRDFGVVFQPEFGLWQKVKNVDTPRKENAA